MFNRSKTTALASAVALLAQGAAAAHTVLQDGSRKDGQPASVSRSALAMFSGVSP